MTSIKQNKKVTLFFLATALYLGTYLLFLSGDQWIWYAGSGLLFLCVDILMAVALRKCDQKIYDAMEAVFLFLLASSSCVMTLLSRTDHRQLIVLLLYLISLPMLLHPKVALLVPVISLAMAVISPTPAFHLLLLSCPLFYHVYMKNRKHSPVFAVALILEIVSVLLTVVVCLRSGNTFFCPIIRRERWFNGIRGSWYLLIPLVGFFSVFWRAILQKKQDLLCSNTLALCVVISVLFLLLFGDALPILYIVLLCDSAWLLFACRDVLSGADDTSSLFDKKSAAIALALIVTIALNFVYVSRSNPFNLSMIGVAIRHFLAVNP